MRNDHHRGRLRRREVAEEVVAPAMPQVRLELLAAVALVAPHALETRRILSTLHQRQPLRRRRRVRLRGRHRRDTESEKRCDTARVSVCV